MARDLTANQQSRIQDNPYRAERLVELQTPAGSYYYTTGDFDVSASTDTSGGTQTYLANNGIEMFGVIAETHNLAVNTIQISIGDVDDTIYDNIVRQTNDYDFQRSLVNIYWLYRSVSSGVAYSSDIITLFQGVIAKVDYNRTETDAVLNINANSRFSNFELINGRRTSDFVKGQFATTVKWGNLS